MQVQVEPFNGAQVVPTATQGLVTAPGDEDRARGVTLGRLPGDEAVST
jgi:hypothetical protein